MALSHVIRQGIRQRSSLAFWAHPLTGKSSCIEALELIIPQKFPGAGILVHEAKRDTVVAEGSFIGDILLAMEYEAKLKRGLPERRDQLRRALFALGAGASQLFLVIDEAQNLAAIQLEWLKEYINWLIKRRYKVTVILFGQQELTCKRDELIEVGRTDLHARFTQNLMEFEGAACGDDLLPLLDACDSGSEFPPGSGCSYTNFLWPEAFNAGFRLASQRSAFACALELDAGEKRIDHGVIMEYVARSLAEFAEATRLRDGVGFSPTVDDWLHAVKLSGYCDRPPYVYRSYSRPVPTNRSRKCDQYA